MWNEVRRRVLVEGASKRSMRREYRLGSARLGSETLAKICRRRGNPPGVRSSNPAVGSGGSVLVDGGSCLVGGWLAGAFVGSVAAAVEVDVVGGVDEPVEHGLGDDRVGEQRIPVTWNGLFEVTMTLALS